MALTTVDLISAYQRDAETYYEPEREAWKKQYDEQLAEVQKSYSDVIDRYNSMFDPLKSSYTAQQSAYKTQANYDISQAYTNYKKQQLNLLQTQRLGTGLKEELSSSLQSSYKSIFSQLKEQEQQNLYNAAQTYAKNVTDLESEIQSQKNAQAKAEESLEKTYNEGVKSIDTAVKDYTDKSVALYENFLEYMRESTGNDEINLNWLVNEGYLKPSVYTDKDTNVAYEKYDITDYGKDLYSKYYFSTNAKGQRFHDFMENKYTEATTEKEKQSALDLLTFLSENETRFKDSLGLYTTDENGNKIYETGYDDKLGLKRRVTSEKYKKKVTETETPKELAQKAVENGWVYQNYQSINKYLDSLEDEYKKYTDDLGLDYEKYAKEITELVENTKKVTKDADTFGESLLFWRTMGDKDAGTIRKNINKKIKELNEKIKKDALGE